jgi:hypothetical protein
MSEPVFVIHGVGNRNHQQAFESRVAALGDKFAGRLTAVPVYWGDLGADDRYVDEVVPRITGDRPADVRGAAATPDEPTQQAVVATLLAGAAVQRPAVTRGAAAGPSIIAEAASSARPATDAVRGGGTRPQWEAEIRQVWPSLRYLPLVEDEASLREIGRALAAEGEAAVPGQGPAVTRGPRQWVQQRLHDMDRAVGAVAGQIAGRLNTYLRTELGPGVARFIGDILVYQRNQSAIQQRVWDALARYDRDQGRDPGRDEDRTGGPHRPAKFIAHSLGGVITLDMCVRAQNPLYTSGLITFGSQWPLFQLIDPRMTTAPFSGSPLTLPRTIQRWVNLWEPMDPLAFLAARVLVVDVHGDATLPRHSGPDDRMAAHLLSSGLWTHSAYWQLPELEQAVADVLLSG